MTGSSQNAPNNTLYEIKRDPYNDELHMYDGKWNIEINELHLHNSQRITGE